MDVQQILSAKIDRLPAGDHTDGLKAVRLHIDTAVRHLIRGQSDADESAFTDAIYRCNQAFEGSVKEAYRVLAGNAPEKKTPAHIENFLLTENILRTRVLDQFRNYRTEWRNPSTHDYMLGFDEDEALLAIVSVTVFAIVLCDQIDGKLAYRRAEAETSDPNTPTEIVGNFLTVIAEKVRDFSAGYVGPPDSPDAPLHRYIQLEGALGGYLAAEFSKIAGVKVDQLARIDRYEADIVVENGAEKIPIEIKLVRNTGGIRAAFERAVYQASRYLTIPGVAGSVILIFTPGHPDYAVLSSEASLPNRLKIVIGKEAAIKIRL